jgi:RsiW-degrading membrane proteinase PrsW (M82 family)
MELLPLIPIIVIAFIPILMWGYIFSYLDNSALGIRRFGLGIFAWALSVVPVLFMSNIMDLTHLTIWNIFPFLLHWNNYTNLTISLMVTLGVISGSIFIFSMGLFSPYANNIWKTYIQNTLLVFFIGGIFAVFHTILMSLNIFESPLENGWVTVSWVVFGSLKLVLFYYLVIAIIEEVSKHFCVLTSSLTFIDSVKKWVLFSIFIGLGFWFIENILYLKNISEQQWFLSSGLITTWIFRSIFSLMTHIICSVIVGLYFSRAYIMCKWIHNIFPYIKTILFGFLFSIIIHAIFDISLTLWFTWIIFIYFFWWYLGITRIFYNEE